MKELNKIGAIGTIRESIEYILKVRIKSIGKTYSILNVIDAIPKAWIGLDIIRKNKDIQEDANLKIIMLEELRNSRKRRKENDTSTKNAVEQIKG